MRRVKHLELSLSLWPGAVGWPSSASSRQPPCDPSWVSSKPRAKRSVNIHGCHGMMNQIYLPEGSSSASLLAKWKLHQMSAVWTTFTPRPSVSLQITGALTQLTAQNKDSYSWFHHFLSIKHWCSAQIWAPTFSFSVDSVATVQLFKDKKNHNKKCPLKLKGHY